MALPEETTEDPILQNRPKRFLSHTLVELRKFKRLPFLCHSAVVLDISSGGFKLEFTGETISAPGRRYWLHIPLEPLGIYAPKRLMSRVEVRWFDETRFRIGGTFTDLSKTERLVVEQTIESLKQHGQI